MEMSIFLSLAFTEIVTLGIFLYILKLNNVLHFTFTYIYAFIKRFYPKRLTVHSGYTLFYQYIILSVLFEQLHLQCGSICFELIINNSKLLVPTARKCFNFRSKTVFSTI